MKDTYLEHHGILGMKWGVRRSEAQLLRARGKLEKEYGDLEDQMTYGKNANRKKNAVLEKRMREIEKELNTTNTKSKRNVNSKKEITERKEALKNKRTMSDAELKKRVDRLRMEKEFKNLTEEDLSPGRKYASEILSSAGKKALTVAVAGGMTYAVKAAMTKEFNIKEAASYVAANPNKKK